MTAFEALLLCKNRWAYANSDHAEIISINQVHVKPEHFTELYLNEFGNQ